MYKSSTVASFAYLFSLSQGQGLEMLIQHQSPWGKWKEFEHCPREYAHCGVQMKRESGKKSYFDDYGATTLKFRCCHIDDWSVQTEYIAKEDSRGEWEDFLVCNENTWIMGFETRYQSTSVSDDTAMTGIRIKCNNRELTDEHYLEDSFNYGGWKT